MVKNLNWSVPNLESKSTFNKVSSQIKDDALNKSAEYNTKESLIKYPPISYNLHCEYKSDYGKTAWYLMNKFPDGYTKKEKISKCL